MDNYYQVALLQTDGYENFITVWIERKFPSVAAVKKAIEEESLFAFYREHGYTIKSYYVYLYEYRPQKVGEIKINVEEVK